MKRCSICGLEKPDSDFSIQKAARGRSERLHTYCKICSCERTAQWRRDHPEARIPALRQRVLWQHGLTEEIFASMLKEQNNNCAVCARILIPGRYTHIDHNHATGQIRGLLCHACNTGIGHLRDSPTILRQAADYLEKHKNKTQ